MQEQKKIIVGWGLAGAVLAWQFHFNKQGFSVYDSGENHCSRIAAGLVNPIVFKRLTKSWKAEVLMPYAEEFYTKIESELNLELLSRKDIYRLLGSVEEQNNWYVKAGDEQFKHYMEVDREFKLSAVNDEFGWGRVKTFGNLNTSLFLDASKKFFIQQGVEFENKHFDYAEMVDEHFYFFSEGAGIKNNPLFNYLPMKPTHGEIMTIESKEFNAENTINRNMFIMPVGENHFKIGSTYNWSLDQPIATAEGKAELLERLAAFTNFQFKISSHNAGIRPTVSDRRPLLGQHPVKKNAFIFNGLGTKGVMIAPFFSEQLVQHVFKGEALDVEVDIKRFEK